MKLFLTFALLLVSLLAQASDDKLLRINQIQVLGSHNSYKKAIDTPLMLLLQQMDDKIAKSLEYWHPPVSEQLDSGLRKLELDVFYDPEGGRYASPFGAKLPATDAYDPEGLMKQPGFKVLHVQDIDFRSHCHTLKQCLQTLRSWSDKHPGHLPVVISFNAKDAKIDRPDFVEPLPFTSTAFDALDAEIRDVIPPAKLITPDDVRGEHATLEKAVLAGQWPTLEEAVGRFLLVLDETGDKQQAYLTGHPSLQGRVMFVNAPVGQPEAAFLILNDPVGQQEEIRERVKQGYLVRTRADADTLEARENNTKRAEAAFASGAQFVSTDYYLPATHFETDYQVMLPGAGNVRCNPVNSPENCETDGLNKENSTFSKQASQAEIFVINQSFE